MAARSHPLPYESILIRPKQCQDEEVLSLLENLRQLPPMDKNGPMSGACDRETSQMEAFLHYKFGFRNISERYIVDGVKSFNLQNYPEKMQPETLIHFPQKSAGSFVMTVDEIKRWQRSYKVYADRNVQGMTKEFLQKALRGESGYGEEAFRMKFVVRISTCPILMEFDAKVISRQLKEDWPNKIKLVSVTGIDFAGRKHDVGDVLYYIPNWREVFRLDPRADLPAVFHDRDFYPVDHAPQAILNEDRLRDSLTRMVRLRLRACDEEGVQIAVETGIGLGVFSGKHIGIDERVRTISAQAIRVALERDGSTYKKIRAVVLALPIFNRSASQERAADTFDDFVREFRKGEYTGCIPVLIADQDMHRLAVAIARQGFIVSELNPADSHGVFGEYWQNRGPAVEEKLALTTLGLLVQHHLINSEVLNTNNYRLVDLPGTSSLDYVAALLGNSDDRRPIGQHHHHHK